MKWHNRIDWYEVAVIFLAVLVVRTILMAISVLDIPWYAEYGIAIVTAFYVGFKWRQWKVNQSKNDDERD